MTEASTIAVSAEAGQPVGGQADEGRSLASDAWRQLKGNPIFWVSVSLITLFVVMALVPQLFTNVDPGAAVLKEARAEPGADAWFGRDIQGYDIYSRTVYGARASILVGVFSTLATVVIGLVMGVLAGYYGGFLDTLVSRVTDIFFAIPLLLGGILFMSTFPNDQNTPYLVVVGKVVLVLSVFGWPSIARLMRSSVLQVKPNDYVQAARALGASPWRIIRSHVMPNALAPVIVVSTINLGVFITAEATLSFLGIGLTPPAVSWGVAISDALVAVRTYPHILLFPSLFLSLAVLAFIMLGDAVRDAFDPKSR
ncbi:MULTISPECIES: ABC transporter permease [unclassified Phycicoccus]|uniref:ABC transporter permease n=1 Tax=unclassified Phycicoccus TaxID=2637926 RepID=UPI0007034E21|nr:MULTISPECIES: ABC transporter permease [unclassified Phycicoccus]KQU70747.1 peptide ABC transporter permease [Phycicoccus sp. Root101]KQZ89050.1 peptide ABC transporter permease [Phycicoccus sp. Root563]